MLIFLPKKLEGLEEIEKWLTEERLAVTLVRLDEREVDVMLPRFKFQSQYALKKPLGAMGMAKAFTDKADFSGMAGGKEPLFLANVIHKAFVAVDEKGTEAGAATAVVVETKADKGEPIAFHADRPFLFLIRDNRSGAILFLGRVSDPTK
jgi:serpin B